MFGVHMVMMIIMAAILAACGPAASQGGFDSANPAARMYAIERAARLGDRTAIPRLVEQLDSDDPAVRSLAIAALQRLTGETFGYRDFDPLHLRRQAIERWITAIQDGAVVIPAEAGESRTATETHRHHG